MISGIQKSCSDLTMMTVYQDNYILHAQVITPIFKVWDEITYQFLNFNGATVEV